MIESKKVAKSQYTAQMLPVISEGFPITGAVLIKAVFIVCCHAGIQRRDRGPDPLKILNLYGRVSKQYLSESYQASIRCWAIIVPPARRHFNCVSLAGPDVDPLKVVFGSPLHS